METDLQNRKAPLEMAPEEFRRVGYRVVDRLADFLKSLPRRPVTPGVSPGEIRSLLGNKSLPQKGIGAEKLVLEAASVALDPHKWLYSPPEAGFGLGGLFHGGKSGYFRF